MVFIIKISSLVHFCNTCSCFMDEISLHLCDDIMPILKVSPILSVSSIKVLLSFFFKFYFKVWLKYLRIIYHRSSFSTKVPTRLKPSLLQPLALEPGMLRRCRCDCWGWCSDAFFSEIGRWVECATRIEASFLVLSTPHFSPLLPATETLPYLWDPAPI